MSYAYNIPFRVERGAPPGPTWTDGCYYNQRGELVSDPNWSALDMYLPVTPGGRISWRWAISGSYPTTSIVAYDADLAVKDYWANNQSSGSRTIWLTGYDSYVYFRMCCITSDKEHCFFKDEITGEYLYKGALVE